MKKLSSSLYEKPLVTIPLALVIGLSIGWFLKAHIGTKHIAEPVSVRTDLPQYKFINPILYTKTDKSLFAEFGPLDDAVGKAIQSAKDAGDARSVSVYFRDLNSGHWTGVNEDEMYDPGSMLKVAVLVAYLDEAERTTDLLDHIYSYTPHTDPGQHYKPTKTLSPGLHLVRDLLTSMIVYSDNDATTALVNNNEVAYQKVYNELKLPVGDNNTPDFMSVKDYAALYQVLYNSTYLPGYLSEQALALLASSDFSKGLLGGLPPNMIVAHKFGEHTSLASDGTLVERELHDCGIVYFPTKPYFVCVMTKGQDFSRLETVIQNVSKIIYKNVSTS